MEGNEGGSGGNTLPSLFSGTLREDTAEYMLFVFNDAQEGTATAATASKPLAKLDQLRKSALRLSDNLTKDYIWQRDGFDLGVVSQKGLLYLRGLTSYGDCIEDEWLVVYMLRELTKSFPGAWARVCDSDGEFLLVEGAKAVPTWLNPEIDANRVWIHDGMLKVIPLDAIRASGLKPAGFSEQSSITLAEAVQIIKMVPDSLLHLQTLEDEAFYRLRKYPGHVTTSIHYTRLVLPRKIAYILHDRPRAVAPAIEAFASRDPLTTKRILDMTHPERSSQFYPTDLVIVSVKFTKVLYAQLRGQRFTPPKGWRALFAAHAEAVWHPKGGSIKGKDDAVSEEKLDVMVEKSMKLTFGFEIMALTAETSNSRTVREVGLVLEDLAEDGNDSISLPNNEEIQSWKDVDRESDDLWLNINFEDFERELDGSHQNQGDFHPLTQEAAAGKKELDSGSGFGDVGVQTDLRRIVSQFQTFLNDNDAGLEGMDFGEMDRDNDDDDDADDDNSEEEEDRVSFNEEEFSRLMREMMGLPPSNVVTKAESPTGTHIGREETTVAFSGSLPEDSKGDIDEEEEGIFELAAQFEAELKGHGALRLNPPKSSREAGSTATKNITVDGEAIDRTSDADSESYDEREVDVDFNLAKNLLESFKGQEGMSGPAGNLLSILGVALPRDDDEDERANN